MSIVFLQVLVHLASGVSVPSGTNLISDLQGWHSHELRTTRLKQCKIQIQTQSGSALL
jgi:hypothetical protein